MNKGWQHFKTITKHRHEVMKNCFKAGIFMQGCLHDLSKYNPEEFLMGAKYYEGYRSPNEKERELKGYSRAWLHHKGRNKHHYEYWIDYDCRTNKMVPVKMPTKYVIEMFCDRVAASKIYMKEHYTDESPLRYFEKGKKDKMIHPETAQLIEKLLTLLAEKGEAYTFSTIKKMNKKDKQGKDS